MASSTAGAAGVAAGVAAAACEATINSPCEDLLNLCGFAFNIRTNDRLKYLNQLFEGKVRVVVTLLIDGRDIINSPLSQSEDPSAIATCFLQPLHFTEKTPKKEINRIALWWQE